MSYQYVNQHIFILYSLMYLLVFIIATCQFSRKEEISSDLNTINKCFKMCPGLAYNILMGWEQEPGASTFILNTFHKSVKLIF